MKYRLLLAVILACSGCVPASDFMDTYDVDWASPTLFTADKIVLNNDQLKMECVDCKCMEIRTSAGLTGLFIAGHGWFDLKPDQMQDSFTYCMLRFNPADTPALLSIRGRASYTDAAFRDSLHKPINKMFMHSYHRGWQAHIPTMGAYTLSFNSRTWGELLASYDAPKNIKVVYSYTTGKQY